MATIEEAIAARINAQITTVANKIFPLEARADAVAPYATYRRISTGRHPTLTEQGSSEVAFQFDIIGTSYSNMLTVRNAIKTAFEDILGQYTAGAPAVQRVEILNELDGYDMGTDQYTGMIEISFFYN